MDNKFCNGIVVDLGSDSCFSSCDKKRIDNFRITRYTDKVPKEHHPVEKYEYSINSLILNADVLINLAKPKSHRKAGMTACMKNIVGVYKYNENEQTHIFKVYIHKLFCESYQALGKAITKEPFREGSWYGNDTIWRTIV